MDNDLEKPSSTELKPRAILKLEKSSQVDNGRPLVAESYDLMQTCKAKDIDVIEDATVSTPDEDVAQAVDVIDISTNVAKDQSTAKSDSEHSLTNAGLSVSELNINTCSSSKELEKNVYSECTDEIMDDRKDYNNLNSMSDEDDEDGHDKELLGPLALEDYLAEETDLKKRMRTLFEVKKHDRSQIMGPELTSMEATEGQLTQEDVSSANILVRTNEEDAVAWRYKIQLLVSICFLAFTLVVMAEFLLSWGYSSVAFALHMGSAVVFFAAVPAVHLSGSSAIAGWQAFMPFKGGISFVSMQAVAWMCYACALLLFIHTFVSFYQGLVDGLFGMFTLWGALALMSQILVTSSFFQYEHTDNVSCGNTEHKQQHTTSSNKASNDLELMVQKQARRRASEALLPMSSFGVKQLEGEQNFSSKQKRRAHTSDRRVSVLAFDKIPNFLVESVPYFLGMNLFLVLVGLGLAFLSTLVYEDNPIFATSAAVSSCMFFTLSVFNTYGTGGHTMHVKGKANTAWAFYQPFEGGYHFVEMQIASWVLFCTSIALQVGALIATYALGMQVFIGIIGVAGFLSFVAEISMIASLNVYGMNENSMVKRVQKFVRRTIDDLHNTVLVTIIVNTLYVPFIMFWIPFFVLVPSEEVLLCWGAVCLSLWFFIFSFIFVLNERNRYARKHMGAVPKFNWKQYLVLGAATDIPVLFCTHYVDSIWSKVALHASLLAVHVYVLSTFTSDPAVTGSRRSIQLRVALRSTFDRMQAYFKAKVIKKSILEPNQPYMIGFHPHGVVPMTVLWLTLTTDWKKCFPGVLVNPCTASVIHILPLLRDIFQGLGFRDVTRDALINILKAKESVMLVPGGQAEMVYSTSRRKEITIVTKHKGFIRLAVTSGVPLVPILSFGETLVLSNFEARETSTFFIKTFGIPVPFFPYGRYFLPIPRPVPVTVIVGTPIQVNQNDEPDPLYIDAIHKQYYGQIKDMFHEYKDEAGHGGYELIMI
eukprot:CFRG6537T1